MSHSFYRTVAVADTAIGLRGLSPSCHRGADLSREREWADAFAGGDIRPRVVKGASGAGSGGSDWNIPSLLCA